MAKNLEKKTDGLFYDENNENPLTKEQLQYLLTNESVDDITSWIICCRYIMKMKLDDWHYLAMEKTLRSQCSLTMAPRGLGKSYLLTTSYVLFKILKYPNIRIGVVSANYTSAQAFSSELKQYFEENMSPIWEIFDDLRGEKWSGSKFSLKREKIYKEPTVSCYSMNSNSAMGVHVDEWIFDDPVSELNSDTEAKRSKFKNRFHSVFEKAVVQNGPKNFRIIGTPWHMDDFYAYIRTNPVMAKKYTPIILPAVIKNKKTGEERSICEWQLSWEDLMEAKALDTRSWKMQYLMQTFNNNGTLFKAKYIQYYHSCGIENGRAYVKFLKANEDDFEEVYEEKIYMESVWLGCDLASAAKDKSDDMVVAVIGVDKQKNIYLLDMYVGKPLASNILKAIHKMYKKWHMAKRIGIESNAFQKFIFDMINEKYDMPTKKVYNTKSKYDRFYQFSAAFENGKVFIKKPFDKIDTEEKRQWNENYYKLESQMLNFVDGKDGAHDDLPDAFCMAWELYVSESLSADTGMEQPVFAPGTFNI